MCGRYASRMDAAAERDWALQRAPAPFARYNIAPTQRAPVIRSADGERQCELRRWGLVPHWTRGALPRFSTFNARAETIASAASFRGPWRHAQRCIVPALGFYEWQIHGRTRQPYFIYLTERETFGFAGLWERSVAADGTAIDSFSIITVPANPLLAIIHNGRERMPAILPPDAHAAWLDGPAEAALECLAPYPQSLMAAHPVSKRVNAAQHDDPSLITPLPVEDPAAVAPDGVRPHPPPQ